MSLLSYSYCITGISKPADTEFINLKLIIRGDFIMFVKEIEGRRHYVCNECKKPYSFKVGKTSAPEWSVTAVTAHPRPIPRCRRRT